LQRAQGGGLGAVKLGRAPIRALPDGTTGEIKTCGKNSSGRCGHSQLSRRFVFRALRRRSTVYGGQRDPPGFNRAETSRRNGCGLYERRILRRPRAIRRLTADQPQDQNSQEHAACWGRWRSGGEWPGRRGRTALRTRGGVNPAYDKTLHVHDRRAWGPTVSNERRASHTKRRVSSGSADFRAFSSTRATAPRKTRRHRAVCCGKETWDRQRSGTGRGSHRDRPATPRARSVWDKSRSRGKDRIRAGAREKISDQRLLGCRRHGDSCRTAGGCDGGNAGLVG